MEKHIHYDYIRSGTATISDVYKFSISPSLSISSLNISISLCSPTLFILFRVQMAEGAPLNEQEPWDHRIWKESLNFDVFPLEWMLLLFINWNRMGQWLLQRVYSMALTAGVTLPLESVLVSMETKSVILSTYRLRDHSIPGNKRFTALTHNGQSVTAAVSPNSIFKVLLVQKEGGEKGCFIYFWEREKEEEKRSVV